MKINYEFEKSKKWIKYDENDYGHILLVKIVMALEWQTLYIKSIQIRHKLIWFPYMEINTICYRNTSVSISLKIAVKTNPNRLQCRMLWPLGTYRFSAHLPKSWIFTNLHYALKTIMNLNICMYMHKWFCCLWFSPPKLS